ncbi:MAG: S41 family peptidase [Candidatus Peregrinibacteria bacterium]|nr:S41 family peptidase [Candidatus Peregrinibacteria bacterium]
MKKFLSLVLLLALMVPLSVQAASGVVGVEDYTPAIEYLHQTGVIDQEVSGFLPDKTINKGDLYKLAWDSAGLKDIKTSDAPSGFADVSPTSKYAPYVRKSVESGVLKKGGMFLPNAKVTRIDALKTIYTIMGIGITRAFDKKEVTFRDLQNNSEWAALGKTALEFGIWNTQQMFNPRQKITRGEAAYFIYKIASQLRNEAPPIQIVSVPVSDSQSTFVSNSEFRVLDEVWSRIHDKFVFRDKIDDKKLIQGAIDGMVKKLDDKYTVYQEPTAAKNFNEALSGEFDGIGISIDLIEGKVIIVSPIKGTPANDAGLKANDIIVEIDKKSVKGLKLSEVSDMIKGPAGTSIELVIQRDGKEKTFTIVRKRIKLDAVTSEMKGNVGYIIIRNFTEASGIEFGREVKSILTKNPRSIVIDLRDNPGGYLDASLQMLDYILPAKTRLASLIFAKRDTAEQFLQESAGMIGRAEVDPIKPEVIFYAVGNGELSNLPVKVLINGGSASASEIMAASLKENHHATLIGEKSFGKGTVQEIADFVDGSMFKQTIGRWQTPDENNLTANPIVPDVTVVDDPKTVKDEALDYALSH